MSAFLGAGPDRARRVAVIALIAAVVWLLAACTSSGSDSSDGAAVGGGDVAYDEGAPEAADGGTASVADTTDGDRAFIITGEMFMTVDDPVAAADAAADIVVEAGGRVDARRQTAATEYEGGSASLTLRIPADRLDATVESIGALGTVDEYSSSAADVTREVQDLEARISTLRASTERIEALLASAEKIADIITLEDELASRQAELESLEARQRGLDDQVAMSTIGLSLTTEPVVIVDDSPRTFWDGLASGWDSLVAFLTGGLVILGVALPWLAVAAVIVGATWAVVRSRRSRRAPAPASPASSPTGDDGDAS